MTMKPSIYAALLAVSVLAEPTFGQAPPTTAPAPPPTVTAPAVVPGAPVAPLTTGDEKFVMAQLEGNMAEIQAGQLALKNSHNQDVRQFAEKMITDHSYALKTLDQIAAAHHMQLPTMLTEQDRDTLERLSKFAGPAFDRAYVDSMVRAHAMMVEQLNAQLVHGHDQHINAWVQNTRPIVLQHSEIAKQLQASLPARTG
jgi:putative membrane protein